MEYTVYVIKSIEHKYSYTGITNNLNRRINEHNKGKNTSTKNYKPFKIVYQEILPNSKDARIREKFFKSGQGRKRIKENLL